MKANGAPEKIYLQQYNEDTLICLNKYNIHEEWTEKPCNQKIATNIKYIRSDDFIEKAAEWIETHVEYYMKSDKTCNIPMCPLFSKMDFIENFKKAMEL